MHKAFNETWRIDLLSFNDFVESVKALLNHCLTIHQMNCQPARASSRRYRGIPAFQVVNDRYAIRGRGRCYQRATMRRALSHAVTVSHRIVR